MIKYAFLFFLLLFSDLSFALQQEQQTDNKEQQNNEKTTTVDSENKEAASQPSSLAVEPPISQIKVYESDLTHYLSESSIQNLMVGPDVHMAIVTPHAAANQKGVMVLLPEWQQPAISPQALHHLQKTLPEQGWVVINLQPLAKPTTFPSTAIEPATQAEQNTQALQKYKQTLSSLVQTAIEKAQNYPGIIVFVAQGYNAMLVSELFAEKATPLPQALVLLSAKMSPINRVEQSAEKMASLELPVLDLFLRVDTPDAERHAKIRQKHVFYLAKSQFRQKQLHNLYAGYYPSEPLIKEINGWLKSIGW